MIVQEVMNKKPKTISKSTSLMDAAKEMLSNDFSFLPISENGKITSVVTSEDIAKLALNCMLKGTKLDSLSLNEVANTNVQYCYEKDDVKKAIDIMIKNELMHLPVYDANNHIVGVVSIVDLAEKLKDKISL